MTLHETTRDDLIETVRQVESVLAKAYPNRAACINLKPSSMRLSFDGLVLMVSWNTGDGDGSSKESELCNQPTSVILSAMKAMDELRDIFQKQDDLEQGMAEEAIEIGRAFAHGFTGGSLPKKSRELECCEGCVTSGCWRQHERERR